MNTTCFLNKSSMKITLFRLSKCIPFLGIDRHISFTNIALKHRFHDHKNIPVFRKFQQLAEVCFHLLFRINAEPILNISKSHHFFFLQHFTFFEKRNTWNLGCIVKKPRTFLNKTKCFFHVKSCILWYFQNLIFFMEISFFQKKRSWTSCIQGIGLKIKNLRILFWGLGNWEPLLNHSLWFCFMRNPKWTHIFMHNILVNRTSLLVGISFVFILKPILLFFINLSNIPHILIIQHDTLFFPWS